MRTIPRALALVFLGLLCATSLLAQPTQPTTTTTLTAAPRLVRVSSTFYPADGLAAAPVESVMFAIYAQESGGTPLWQETQSVAVDRDGGYLVLLGSTRNEGLPLSIQNFIGNNPLERAAHQRPALARTHQLFSRNSKQEFEQVPVEVGIALFSARVR